MWQLTNEAGEVVKTFATAEQANDWQDAISNDESYELAFIDSPETLINQSVIDNLTPQQIDQMLDILKNI